MAYAETKVTLTFSEYLVLVKNYANHFAYTGLVNPPENLSWNVVLLFPVYI